MTLRSSRATEFGRGLFKAAIVVDFSLLVAMQHFGVTDRRLLWMLASAPFVGMIAAVFAASLTGRRRKKSVVLALETVSRLTLLVAAFATSGPAFCVVVAVGTAFDAVAVPLVSGIYGANFNRIVRGQAVGRLQAITLGATAAAGYLGGLALDMGTGYYRGVYVTLSLLSLVCAWFVRRLPEARKPARRALTSEHIFRDFFHVLTHDKGFLYLELIWFIFGFCNLWLMPLKPLHLDALGFSPGQIVFAGVTLFLAVQLATLGLWGRLLYRINFALYRMLTNIVILAGMLTFFHATTYPVVCLGAAIWGVGLAGGGLSWRLVATLFTTRDRVPVYMCIHTFIAGIRGLVGPHLSLGLDERYGAPFVANISAAGIGLTIVMLVFLIPIMQRRRCIEERA